MEENGTQHTESNVNYTETKNGSYIFRTYENGNTHIINENNISAYVFKTLVNNKDGTAQIAVDIIYLDKNGKVVQIRTHDNICWDAGIKYDDCVAI